MRPVYLYYEFVSVSVCIFFFCFFFLFPWIVPFFCFLLCRLPSALFSFACLLRSRHSSTIFSGRFFACLLKFELRRAHPMFPFSSSSLFGRTDPDIAIFCWSVRATGPGCFHLLLVCSSEQNRTLPFLTVFGMRLTHVIATSHRVTVLCAALLGGTAALGMVAMFCATTTTAEQGRVTMLCATATTAEQQ